MGYFAGSAVVLAGSRVRRSLAGIVGVTFFLMLAEESGLFSSLNALLVGILRPVVIGRYA